MHYAKFQVNKRAETAYARATMPESNPGSLSDQEYIDIIAYMPSVGRLPSGDDELIPDPQSLARAVIRQKPSESQ
jgi:hypothetical protein